MRKGTWVGMVNASDADSGRNSALLYALEGEGGGEAPGDGGCPWGGTRAGFTLRRCLITSSSRSTGDHTLFNRG